MNILAFDCSSTTLNLFLSTGNKIYTRTYTEGLKHSTRLMPAIDSILKEAETELSDMDLISCTSGPGSFTGLRIAMATAKGLSAGSGIPFASIPTLEFMSQGFTAGQSVIPVIDGKKDRFYCALYRDTELIDGPWDISAQQLEEKLAEYPGTVLTGADAQSAVEQMSNKAAVTVDPACNLNRTSLMGQAAKKCFEKNGPDADGSGPFYLRKSQAEE